MCGGEGGEACVSERCIVVGGVYGGWGGSRGESESSSVAESSGHGLGVLLGGGDSDSPKEAAKTDEL